MKGICCKCQKPYEHKFVSNYCKECMPGDWEKIPEDKYITFYGLYYKDFPEELYNKIPSKNKLLSDRFFDVSLDKIVYKDLIDEIREYLRKKEVE